MEPFSKPHNEPSLNPAPNYLNSRKDWEELTETTFDIIFKNSAVKRTRYKGLKEILHFSMIS